MFRTGERRKRKIHFSFSLNATSLIILVVFAFRFSFSFPFIINVTHVCECECAVRAICYLCAALWSTVFFGILQSFSPTFRYKCKCHTAFKFHSISSITKFVIMYFRLGLFMLSGLIESSPDSIFPSHPICSECVLWYIYIYLYDVYRMESDKNVRWCSAFGGDRRRVSTGGGNDGMNIAQLTNQSACKVIMTELDGR